MNRRAFISMAGVGAHAYGKPGTPVRVLAPRQLGTASLYQAQEAGYFQKEGVLVEIETGEGSQSSIPLLAGGRADVLLGSVTPQLFNAMGRGARVRIAAARAHYARGCPDENRIFGSHKAFPDGFSDVRQMRGKRVAVSGRIGMTSYVFHKALQSAGLRVEDIALVTLEFREAATLLASDKLDVCFGGNEAILNSSFRERVVHGPRFSTFVPDLTIGYLHYGKRLLDESPDDGVRFLRALLRGQRDYAAGVSPRFLSDYAKENGLDEASAKKRCRAEISLDGELNEVEIQQFIDWGMGMGHISSPIRASDAVDRRFLNGARKA